MPYARRDTLGQVASLHRQAEPGAEEFLPDDHAEVLAFVGRTSDGAEGFARLDADFVRVLEDVIDALVQRHLINITDLPAEAQRKLFSRKGYRERASRHALELFGLGDLDALGPLLGQAAPPGRDG
jgi:hypothetical protein